MKKNPTQQTEYRESFEEGLARVMREPLDEAEREAASPEPADAPAAAPADAPKRKTKTAGRGKAFTRRVKRALYKLLCRCEALFSRKEKTGAKAKKKKTAFSLRKVWKARREAFFAVLASRGERSEATREEKRARDPFLKELKKEWKQLKKFTASAVDKLRTRRRRQRASLKKALRTDTNYSFPEFEGFFPRLLCFLRGMAPYSRVKLREKLHARRLLNMHRSGKRQKLLDSLHIRPSFFLAGTLLVAAVAVFFSQYTFGVRVTYHGENLGGAVSAKAVKRACDRVEDITVDVLEDARFALDRDEIQTGFAVVPREEAYSEDDVLNVLSEKLGLVTEGFGLYIDGQLVCATPYPYVLEDMLGQLKYAYIKSGTDSADFSETVEVREGYYDAQYVMDVGSIADVLNSSHEEEVTYTVKKGDVWGRIANDHGMTIAELSKLNPGYNINSLHIGDEIVLSAAVPYLTISSTTQEHYIEDIPFSVEYRDDSSLYKGDYKVISEGVYGKADVLADVTYQNGEEIARTKLAYVPLTEPVTEIQARGTKPRPTWMPSGSFRRPCTGHITSYFGGRNLWGRYNYHGGVDIANKRGTPIYAADGGTVTHAGWYSTYGYLVIIDHGNGYETYYGHNSKLLVHKGEHVYKGQQIAKMGSTGNASGPHCHFEVRYHGARKNPLKYI